METKTDKLMRIAEDLTGLPYGPENNSERLQIATVYALLAIASELKRLNDDDDEQLG